MRLQFHGYAGYLNGQLLDLPGGPLATSETLHAVLTDAGAPGYLVTALWAAFDCNPHLLSGSGDDFDRGYRWSAESLLTLEHDPAGTLVVIRYIPDGDVGTTVTQTTVYGPSGYSNQLGYHLSTTTCVISAEGIVEESYTFLDRPKENG